jgi:hypothetical protein
VRGTQQCISRQRVKLKKYKVTDAMCRQAYFQLEATFSVWPHASPM